MVVCYKFDLFYLRNRNGRELSAQKSQTLLDLEISTICYAHVILILNVNYYA